MSRGLLLSLVAGAAPCFAQVVQPADPIEESIILQGGGYESRAPGFVYDNLSQTFGQTPARWGSVTNWKHLLEDVSFAPGPWANASTRVIDQISWGIRRAAGGPYACDVNFKFWDKDDVNFAGFAAPGAVMINPGATPIADLTIALANQGTPAGGAVGNQFTNTLTTPISIPDDGFWLEASIYEPGTTTYLTTDNFRWVVATNSNLAAPANPATIGSTILDIGFDADNNGTFTGAAAAGATIERRIYNLGTPTRSAGYMFRVRGDIPPPPPPTTRTNAGCIPDSGYSNSGSLAGGDVAWYEVCLVTDATDALVQFLDADTEGSTADVSLALFNSDGQVVSTDADSGSGANAQLSFGVGRRAAVGDGVQYDGRNGQLFAGTYYVAVAPAGSTFGDGFTVGAGAGSGSFTLNLATNVNGTPAAPSVAPIVNHVDYSSVPPTGPIGFPDARQGLGVGVALRGVLWSTFEVGAEAGSGDSFLDIDFARLCTNVADGVAYIFNSNGDFVAYSDDEGEGNLPQFSFGAGSGPRTYPPALSTFEGLNGTLPAGTYYMATALFDTDDLQAIGQGRFHVRGLSGSAYTLGADIYSGGTPGSACDPDVNQDGNVDQDDISCLAQAVAGDPTCLGGGVDPDFNRDGNVDQDDIAALEQSVGGAPCP
ncbi:MAG: hypothetical protein SFY69_07215 [Planctomycetota bacterium]|nr:hypothetical protein [Planctomycetota bacterium]